MGIKACSPQQHPRQYHDRSYTLSPLKMFSFRKNTHTSPACKCGDRTVMFIPNYDNQIQYICRHYANNASQCYSHLAAVHAIWHRSRRIGHLPYFLIPRNEEPFCMTHGRINDQKVSKYVPEKDMNNDDWSCWRCDGKLDLKLLAEPEPEDQGQQRLYIAYQEGDDPTWPEGTMTNQNWEISKSAALATNKEARTNNSTQ